MSTVRTTAVCLALGSLLAPAAAQARPTCGVEDPCPSGEQVHHVGRFDGGGRERLQIHARPNSRSRVVRTVRSGKKAFIVCQTRGSRASGPFGRSRLWNKLARGGYISDTRVFTGSDGRVAPNCGGQEPKPPYGRDRFRYDDPGAWNGGANCSDGYTKGAVALSRWLVRRYRNTGNIGGYACRQNTANAAQMSLHAEGRALDWMISAGSAANRRIVARFVRRVSARNWKLGRALGLQEIIWNGRIWTSARHTEGWRAYTGPNPHTDHVHIGINRPGASKRTSYWR
jgi:hypothetical protein